jgi:CHASE2 domain-containing sensor protein
MRKYQPRTVLVIAVAIALSCAVGVSTVVLAGGAPMQTLEWKAYDAYLDLSPKNPAPGDFLAIYPNNQDSAKKPSIKDSLLVFRLLDEFGIESLALAGDAFEGGQEREELTALRSELPPLVDREYGGIEENIRALFSAIRSGSIPPKELGRYVEELVGIVKSSAERIKEASSEVHSPILSELEAEIERFSATQATIFELQADPDGVLRRVLLIKREGERIVPRVELALLMARLGNPRIKLEPGRIRLVGAKLPKGGTRDIAIPVDGEGRALLAWPRPSSSGAPRRLALDELLSAIREEESLVSALEAMETGGLLVGEGAALLSRYRHAERLREDSATGDRAALAEWREARQGFFSASLAYFEGNHDAELVAGDEGMTKIREAYIAARELAGKLAVRRATLSGSLRGACVFLSLYEGTTPPVTSYGRATSAAYAGAVFASAALSGGTPRRIAQRGSVTLALLLVLIAASLGVALRAAPRPFLGLALGLGVALAGFAVSAIGFVAAGAFIPPLPLVLGPLAALISAIALARRRFDGIGKATRKKVTVAACRAAALLRSAEEKSPKEAARARAAFAERVRAAIEAQGGKLAKNDGSTLLAYFEETSGGKAPTQRALKAAFTMAGANSRIETELGIGIGLDSGECLIAEGALIGPAADLAQRLADLNGHYGTRVLATGAVIEAEGDACAPSLIGELEVEATGRKAALYSVGERLEGPGSPKAE